MAKKQTKKVDNKLNLESILKNCREYLRSNATLNDKRDLLLTLVFLRFIGEKFEDAQIAMREECLKQGIDDEAVIEAFLNSPARYQNVAYVPEAARWGNIINIPAVKLNGALDDALQAIDGRGKSLKGCVRKGLFSSINLAVFKIISIYISGQRCCSNNFFISVFSSTSSSWMKPSFFILSMKGEYFS